MDRLVVKGGQALQGSIKVSGAKNAVLPILAASLLASNECCIKDVPDLADVATIIDVLKSLGATAKKEKDEVLINASDITKVEAPYDFVRKMRASFLVMGPLLARLGEARISLPGGCAIGVRPIDLHLKGFEALGAEVITGHGYIQAKAKKLIGNKIYLDFPSVGATENIMMAASMAEGTTVIENCAEEPEIVDLANFLNNMGGKIKGAGTKVIKIQGVKQLQGVSHNVIPDRIEAGTYMVASAISRGDVLVENIIIDHLKPVIAKLLETGAQIKEEENGIRVIGPEKIKPVDIKTLPYPGYPTDMQAQMMAYLTIAKGTSVMTETVFENRFMHADELRRMGADIKIEGHTAVIEGVKTLTGAPVKATDLRAGAALILAATVAQGQTEISCIHHIDRGYDKIEKKLKNIGVDIKRISN